MAHFLLTPSSSSCHASKARKAGMWGNSCNVRIRMLTNPCRAPTSVTHYNVRLRKHRAILEQQQAQAVTEGAVEEDFYSLLGVSPLADAKEIKRAYYSMMRSCHPDRSGDFEATEFCALLNEVYETLTDPVRRALYDELAGFSAQSINPFLDTRYPADRVFVDEFSCIGCRNCNSVCPRTFSMEEEYGRARAVRQDVDSTAQLQEAIDTCPVSCIHWVSAPQLSLLEAALSRMGRVAVWSMMGGAGANRDVFTEASMAWIRRQSDIRRRMAEAVAAPPPSASASSPSGWGAFWSSGVSFGGAAGSRFYRDADQARQQQRATQAQTWQQQQQQERQETSSAAGPNNNGRSNSTHNTSSNSSYSGYSGGGGGGGDRESRGVAELAARTARAARTWRRFQAAAAASRQQQQQQRKRGALASTSSGSSMDE